jgi:hypothetical protein
MAVLSGSPLAGLLGDLSLSRGFVIRIALALVLLAGMTIYIFFFLP